MSAKATLPASELSAEEVAKMIRETYLSVTVKDKKVKVLLKEPFATIEKLVKLAKKGIEEVGFAEFKQAIISSETECLESIKKEPKGSDFNSSNCLLWWRLGDSNSWPPACKAGALPAELIPHLSMVSPICSRLQKHLPSATFIILHANFFL